MGNVVGFTLTIMVVGALVAAYADARTRRIPNLLTGALAAIAIVAHATGGLADVASAAGVMLVAFLAGTLAFSLGWFGGGDVKLLAACCGLAGFPGATSLVLYTLIAGGFVSIIEAARRGKLRAVLASTVSLGRTGVAPAERIAAPYGIAIAVGACTYALSLSVFQFLRLPL
jgi:prepilin peptidase CpaA